MKKILSALTIILLLSSCAKEESNQGTALPLQINIQLTNNGQPLNTIDQYLNLSGERYNVSSFKFYISGIRLISSNNSITSEQNSYHLVDLAKPESKEISTNFARGTYSRLAFTLGVDSTRNVSGAQTGALDPMNGMFWTWNSGYIFAKLEGNSPSSSAPGQNFTYHIGGFKTGENAIRTITLDFPSDKQVIVGKTGILVIEADLSKWFDGPQQISIAQDPSIMTPGGVSLRIADNYATMFSVKQVITP